MSLEAIGDEVGKHPSTVSYWLKRHGLAASGARKHARRGAVCRDRLATLAASGATLADMAQQLDRSVSTIRYWLARFEIQTTARPGPRRRRGDSSTALFECGRHGTTEFRLEGRGHYRCKRCRSEAVAARRRKVKRKLVDEAGGECALCGYRRWVGALQFHHLDLSRRSSTSRRVATPGHWLDVVRRSKSASSSARTAIQRLRAGSLLCRWI